MVLEHDRVDLLQAFLLLHAFEVQTEWQEVLSRVTVVALVEEVAQRVDELGTRLCILLGNQRNDRGGFQPEDAQVGDQLLMELLRRLLLECLLDVEPALHHFLVGKRVRLQRTFGSNLLPTLLLQSTLDNLCLGAQRPNVAHVGFAAAYLAISHPFVDTPRKLQELLAVVAVDIHLF